MGRFRGWATCLPLLVGGSTTSLGQDGPPLSPPRGTSPADGSSTVKPGSVMTERAGPPLAGPTGSRTSPIQGRPPRPLVIESVPRDVFDEPKPLPDPKPRPAKPADSSKPSSGPVRRGRLFDRFLPSAAPAALPRPANRGRSTDAIAVEPRSDPAADSSLRKKIEKQASEAVGDKATEIEVRVIDRSVTIRAKVDRFWNRRTVRRSLETLPGLKGIKSKVDIVG